MRKQNVSDDFRVLQLGKFYPIVGGVEKVEYDLMMGLSERGIYCDMLCADFDGKGSRTLRINEFARVLVCRTVKKAAATMLSPEMVWTLRRICKEYDVIHIHHPDPMACLALFLSGYGGRVILHWHSDILKQKFLLKLYKPLQSWLIRRAEMIVGTSPVYLKESPFLRKVQEKTFCMPIGIEEVRPDRKAVEEMKARYGGRKIIFTLGRLVEYKGYRHLIEAAQYVKEDVMVLIGGNGPLKAELHQRICELGLEDRVKLLGFVSDEDLPTYYGACDLFCMSSIQKTEAFGIVQIEAMSCGKPVVATRIPGSGVSWVNEEGVSGCNAIPEDAKDLARAFNEVLRDEATYRKYAEGARRRFETWFTKERMIETYLHDVLKK